MVPNKYSHTKERRTMSCLLVRAPINIYIKDKILQFLHSHSDVGKTFEVARGPIG